MNTEIQVRLDEVTFRKENQISSYAFYAAIKLVKNVVSRTNVYLLV